MGNNEVKITIDTNKIKAETIAKLTWREIGQLGLNNAGIYTYRGALKSRKSGYKTVKVNEYITRFEDEVWAWEFIKIQKSEEFENQDEYALRVFDKKAEKYTTDFIMIWGCDFFR